MSYIRAMRHIVLLLAYSASLLVAPRSALAAPGAIVVTTRPAVATPASDAGACYSVHDADARAYCLARAHSNPSMCYSVQRADLRSMCLAEVRQ